MKSANYWIDKLNLEKHPEGGYYKEVYRAQEIIKNDALPNRYQDDRSVATSIYFLLKGDEFSSFHRIKSDETWHFYQGTTLEIYVLQDNGALVKYLMGADYEAKENFQLTIPQNQWFGARVSDPTSFALVGCTVAPGFHFDDFELAERNHLLKEFPKHQNVIKELTFR